MQPNRLRPWSFVWRIFLLSLVALEAPAIAQEDAAKMAEIIKNQSADDRFMGNVLVAKDGAVVFEQSSGWANAEWKIPNGATTKFRIGSVTKQFTAAAILLLAEKAKLQLDDPLSKFVPNAPESWRPVTLLQLLSHTGGIPSVTDQPEYRTWKLSPATPAENMARMADKPLEFAPGEKFKYSNSGYLLLGWIVEIVSGQSYAEFLREHIFQPLGMNDTGIDSNVRIIPSRATGYARTPEGLAHAPFINMTFPAGAGAMYSTTHDLLRWTQGLFGGKILNADSLKRMTTPVKSEYALGLGVRSPGGRTVISHTGGIEGFNSQLAYYPDSKTTIVVLANLTGSPYVQVARQLEAAAFGEPIPTMPDIAAGGGAPKSGFRLTFPGNDVTVIARAFERAYNTKVTLSESVRGKTVKLNVTAPTRDELRLKLIAGLRQNGIQVIEGSDGITLTSELSASGGK